MAYLDEIAQLVLAWSS